MFAAGFSDEAREAQAAQNVVALDRSEMATIAAVWDFPKQAEAIVAPLAVEPGRYRPPDPLLAFLEVLG